MVLALVTGLLLSAQGRSYPPSARFKSMDGMEVVLLERVCKERGEPIGMTTGLDYGVMLPGTVKQWQATLRAIKTEFGVDLSKRDKGGRVPMPFPATKLWFARPIPLESLEAKFDRASLMTGALRHLVETGRLERGAPVAGIEFWTRNWLLESGKRTQAIQGVVKAGRVMQRVEFLYSG